LLIDELLYVESDPIVSVLPFNAIDLYFNSIDPIFSWELIF